MSRLARTLPATLLVGFFAPLALVHCSSIPDVSFGAEDASSLDGPSPGDGSSPQADGGDSGGQQCPTVTNSICCKSGISCVGCTSPDDTDCNECAATCTAGQFCCKKGGKFVCKSKNAQCAP